MPASRGYFRTLLILGRTSNLPTVWSNCLAGWLLGGGDNWIRFIFLCFGATLLYIGGMFLNDAFDTEFDRQHRRERPIPSGAITEKEVWQWGTGLLFIGTISLVWMSGTTALFTLLLVACILIYDAIHKAIAIAPVLMGACRFFLYLVAASAAAGQLVGPAIWWGAALACYIIGLSYIARKESTRGTPDWWPCFLMAVPVLLALLVNDESHKRMGFLLSAVLVVWIVSSLSYTFGKAHKNVGQTVSGLLAGIVLVDLLATGGGTPGVTFCFAALFVSARLFQRFIPAT